MIVRRLQSFLLLAFILACPAYATELRPGSVAHLAFRDVDGALHSTADGHVTIITVVTRQDEEKAELIADRVPDRYLGDPKYRYITLVNFQGKLASPFRGLTRLIIRQRLDAEAQKLKPQYVSRGLQRDPRQDVIVVADFDGREVAKLRLPPESTQLAVFVFNGKGNVIAHWSDVPSEDSLGKAIALAGS